MITNAELVEFALSWLHAPYMYGVNGLPITESLIQAKAKQYPEHYDEKKIARLREQIGLKAVQCNSFTSMILNQSRSANGWLSVAVEKGPIADIPELPGLTVHYDGHMGVYIGGGRVLEARGTFYGVVITRVMDRPWRTWAKMPGIDYSGGSVMIMKIGDKDKEKGGTMGTAVSQWQIALIESGFKMINNNGVEKPIDGDFGTATKNGTADFQRAFGLPVTGAVDLFTYSAMIGALLAIAADKVDRGESDNLRAIINDAMIILERGAI